MRKTFKGALAGMFFAAVLVLTACGSSLDSELTVTDSGEVTRTFTITANIADNREHVTGELADITATVEANCPDVLSFTDLSTDTDAIYQFTMECDSVEEYEEALIALLDYKGEYAETYGDDYDVLVFSRPDSVFASGVYFYETPGRETYMKWFEDLMIDSGYVGSSDRSNIFDGGTTTYNICGEEGTTGYNVSVNTVESLQINSINYYTVYNDNNTLSRKIQINIPQASMDAKGDDIRTFLEANATDGITGEWTVENGVNTYTLIGKNLSVESLNDMMERFYGIEGDYVSANYNPENTDVSTWNISDFYSVVQITESKDLSSFVADPVRYGVTTNYYVSSTNNASIEDIDPYDYSSLYPDGEQNYVFSRAVEFTLNSATVSVAPSESEEGYMTRTVEMLFNNDISNDALKAVETRLKVKFRNTSIRVVEVSATENDMTKIVRESEDEFDEEPDCWNAIFGTADENDLRYLNTSFPHLFTTIKYEDTFDLSPFGYAPDDEDITVVFKVSGFERMKAEEQTITADGNEPVNFTVEQKSLNIGALIIWIVIFVLIAGVVVAVIIVVTKMSKKGKPAAKPASMPVSNPVSAAPDAPAPAAETADEKADEPAVEPEKADESAAEGETSAETVEEPAAELAETSEEAAEEPAADAEPAAEAEAEEAAEPEAATEPETTEEAAEDAPEETAEAESEGEKESGDESDS